MDGMDWLIIVPINVMYTCMFMYSICYKYHGESMYFELQHYYNIVLIYYNKCIQVGCIMLMISFLDSG